MLFVCETTQLSAWHRGRSHLVLQVLFEKVRGSGTSTSTQDTERDVDSIRVCFIPTTTPSGVYGPRRLDSRT